MLGTHDADGELASDQVAPGGWRRVVLGFLIGAAAGAAVGLVLPRDDGPRRSAPGS